jgi:hypothetical protein
MGRIGVRAIRRKKKIGKEKKRQSDTPLAIVFGIVVIGGVAVGVDVLL